MPHLIVHMVAAMVNRFIFGCRIGRPVPVIYGLWIGMLGCLRQFGEPRPVEIKTYRFFRLLRRLNEPPLELAERQLAV
jgi:hypothetical protein